LLNGLGYAVGDFVELSDGGVGRLVGGKVEPNLWLSDFGDVASP
jgi:hypothetical protein